MLQAYDGHPSTPIGLYRNVLVYLATKTILIDIEILDGHLDYNILLGKSYMYAMSAVASSLFLTMMFPDEDCIVTLDQWCIVKNGL